MCGTPDLDALVLMASRFIYFGATTLTAMIIYRYMSTHGEHNEEVSYETTDAYTRLG